MISASKSLVSVKARQDYPGFSFSASDSPRRRRISNPRGFVAAGNPTSFMTGVASVLVHVAFAMMADRCTKGRSGKAT